jgi:hypothetical protein
MDPMSPDELERWKAHQNGIAPAIKDMDSVTLNAFLEQCESTIFETKAKYQIAYQEKALRQVEARTKSRDELITNPRYEPIDSPTVPQGTSHKAGAKKGSKKADLNNYLSSLGLNPGEVIKNLAKAADTKKVEKINEKVAEDTKATQAKIAALPLTDTTVCQFSHTEQHEPDINNICKWCQERVK